MPRPIHAYDSTVINKSLLCKCQLQGEQEFLHETLASCCSACKVDQKMYVTINFGFAYQLQMNFPEAVPSQDFTSKSIDSEPSFQMTLQTFIDTTSNLES